DASNRAKGCIIHPELAHQRTHCREGLYPVPVQIRKLSSDEAAKVFPKRGQMDLSEYTDALRELQPGDAAEIELGPLSSRALKRRLGQAAKQTGYCSSGRGTAAPACCRSRCAGRGARRPGRVT